MELGEFYEALTMLFLCKLILLIPIIILILIIIIMAGQPGDACCGLLNNSSDDINSYEISIVYIGDAALCSIDNSIADTFIVNNDSILTILFNNTNITNITLDECR